MFKSTYLTLFSLVVENTYYANQTGMTNGEAADFNWLPAPGTVEMLKRYGLLFRPTATGFLVLADIRKNEAGNRTTQLPNGVKLLFVMRLQNSALPALTDLPTNTDVRMPLFFFTNQHIHAEAEVNRGNLPITKALAVKPDDQLQTADQRTALLNQLGALANDPVFGAVELVLDPTQPAIYRITEADHTLSMERPVFKIPFQHRKSRWRYDINLSRSDVAIDELSGQNLPSFSRQNLATNRVRFVGDAVADILEKPDPKPTVTLAYRVNVVDDLPLSGTALERILPYPTPESVSSEIDSATQALTVYSTVSITI
ncbi:hypothetical protein [Spirosoma radiotolerans]|uniref:Uncharacterized protein n=1 Tax=Spirosoma radiotolerans TaxID=1379870 RepID=A0A0E3ZUH5_9BACT|nr:hypothetical protein [Spirosoma radiotolerans]AKD55548.1 hypothetical protein SD10_12215 [Spirosoma radiotolerans]